MNITAIIEHTKVYLKYSSVQIFKMSIIRNRNHCSYYCIIYATKRSASEGEQRRTRWGSMPPYPVATQMEQLSAILVQETKTPPKLTFDSILQSQT